MNKDGCLYTVILSIHAPREGSDFSSSASTSPQHFQSTLPAKGATASCNYVSGYIHFQSTLPAKGATTAAMIEKWMMGFFQSTLPAKGATASCNYVSGYIHFQSTLPAKGATCSDGISRLTKVFQSTLPRRERRNFAPISTSLLTLSIHAPREGSDGR